MNALEGALEAALRADGTGATAVGTLSAVLARHGVRSLVVLADDTNVHPCVVTTVEKRDITIPMVQGLVYELLTNAGVANAAPQASIAASFVVRYVNQTIK